MVTPTRLLQFSQSFSKYALRQFTPLISETGLSMREFHVLLFLCNNPGYDTARDITELRGMVKSQVSQAVEVLAARGLLDRRPDETDRRVVHLSLTESGQTLGKQAQNLQAACYAQLLQGFTPEETALLETLLERVLENGDGLSDVDPALRSTQEVKS